MSLSTLLQEDSSVTTLVLSNVSTQLLLANYSLASTRTNKAMSSHDFWAMLLALHFRGAHVSIPRLFYELATTQEIRPDDAPLIAEAFNRNVAQLSDGHIHLPILVAHEPPAEDVKQVRAMQASTLLLHGVRPDSPLVVLHLPTAVEETVAQYWSSQGMDNEPLSVAHYVCADLEPQMTELREFVVLGMLDWNSTERGSEGQNAEQYNDAAALGNGKVSGRPLCMARQRVQQTLIKDPKKSAHSAEPAPELPCAAMLYYYMKLAAPIVKVPANQSKFQSTNETRVLFAGDSGSGKTTSLYLLKLGEIVNTIPTIGFNVETKEFPNSRTEAIIWDVGGQRNLQPLWRHYYCNTDGLALFVDEHAGDESLSDSKALLHLMLAEDELRETKLAIVAISKSPASVPLPQCELVNKLGLDLLGRQYEVFRCGHLDVASTKHVTCKLEQMLQHLAGWAIRDVPDVPQESLELVSMRAADVWSALGSSVEGSAS